jgi:amino-acid N-acetyltransferase
MPLPADYHLRPAQPTDIWAIRWLVLGARLDPSQLRWQQFTVVSHGDQLVACGQLRRHGPAQELGSLVVKPGWRNRGIGNALVQHLVHQADGSLYLECLGDRLAAFYAPLGFVPAPWDTMPDAISKKFRLSAAIATVLPIPLHILEYRPGNGSPSHQAAG